MTKIYVIDAATGDEVLRDMTADELATQNEINSESLNRANEFEQKKQATKTALLALGLDETVAAQIAGF